MGEGHPIQRFVGLSKKMYSIGLKTAGCSSHNRTTNHWPSITAGCFPHACSSKSTCSLVSYYSTKISTAELSSHPSYACQATSRKSRCQCLPPSSSDKAAARELRGHDWGIWLVSTWGMPMATHIENEDGVTRTFKEAWILDVL